MLPLGSGCPPRFHLREPGDQLAYHLIRSVFQLARPKRFQQRFAKIEPAAQGAVPFALEPARFVAITLRAKSALPEIDNEVRAGVLVPLDVEQVDIIIRRSAETGEVRLTSQALESSPLSKRVEGALYCFTERMGHILLPNP